MSPLRLARAGAAALAAMSLTVAALPTAFANTPGTPTPHHDFGKKDKLGSHDRELLVDALREGRKTVTAMVAVAPGQLDATRRAVEAAGGRVAATNAKVGYLRATVPTDAVDAVSQKSSVLAVDLDEEIKLSDPVPAREHGGPVTRGKAPGPRTPAANPYLPTAETGAVAFAKGNPRWDGRGITIGVLDSGVDIDHPALAKTTTGERKIVDWVTATDPLTDATWVEMSRSVTATPTFEANSWTVYTAPADGTYLFGTFYEWATAGDNEINSDVDRDGETWDSFGVLYRAGDHSVWVDTDSDLDFSDETQLRPYRDGQLSGRFGTDDPATEVRESIPFVVEDRLGVDLTPVGRPGETATFVNIGLPAGAHGTHVAGIAAGHGLFGGAMDGAAPGAKIVSSRACSWEGGCTAVGLTEGMIDLVANRGVDVVNMSIGGLPALNDGANARTYLYNALIAEFGVQIFVSAGNSGAGLNTVGDPSVASDVVSVGASVSRETWAADYGSQVATKLGIFGFSSRGPREDGGFKPDIVAPGAAISTTPVWLPGEAVADVGYGLPAGYSMYNGTSMASPQAAGAAALLLSAAKATGVDAAPAKLRAAVYDSARFLPGVPAYAQGNGQISVGAAWQALRAGGLAESTYEISSQVCTALSDQLTTPNQGTGLYDRCGGPTDRYRTVTIVRRTGPAGVLRHRISWVGNDGSFSAFPDTIHLPLNKPMTVLVKVNARGNGAHSAIMVIDNPDTRGVDARMMATVVVSQTLAGPSFAAAQRGQVARAQSRSYFVTVPEHTKTLQVKLDGVAAGNRVRFTAQHPYGMAVETGCYTSVVTEGCTPGLRSFTDPLPGVWEITVEASRSSARETNPYRLTVNAYGVTASADAVLGRIDLHQPAAVSWQVTNRMGATTLAASSSPLTSRRTERPAISQDGQLAYRLNVPLGTTRFSAEIGNPADPDADIDLYVTLNGAVLGASAQTGSEESVVIDNPPAGSYTIYLDGYEIPAGGTEFDYSDDFRAGMLGTVDTTFAVPISLGQNATTTVTAAVTAVGMPAGGRRLFGALDLTSTSGTVVGQAGVTIEGVNGPSAQITGMFGQMSAFTESNGMVGGASQVDAVTTPTVWTKAGGVHPYLNHPGAIYSLNSKGDGAGQADHDDTALPAIFHPDGTVTEVPLPAWGADALYSRAFAINEAGTIAGTMVSYRPEEKYHWRNDNFTWSAANGYVWLANLTEDPELTMVLGINDAGVAVGQSGRDGVPVACWWDAAGAVHEAGTVPGDSNSSLLAINAAGAAVGESGSRAAMWTPGGGFKRLADFGFYSRAIAINPSGWIMGEADVAPYETHVVAWDPQGRLWDLTAMTPQDSFYIEAAVDVTDAGEFIVRGQALDGSDLNNAILKF